MMLNERAGAAMVALVNAMTRWNSADWDNRVATTFPTKQGLAFKLSEQPRTFPQIGRNLTSVIGWEQLRESKVVSSFVEDFVNSRIAAFRWTSDEMDR